MARAAFMCIASAGSSTPMATSRRAEGLARLPVAKIGSESVAELALPAATAKRDNDATNGHRHTGAFTITASPEKVRFMTTQRTYAVFDGRFQPVHVGHLAVMRAIRASFGDPLLVAIISSLPGTGASTSGYSAIVDGHHAPDCNPLTWFERFTMMRLALDADEDLRGTPIIGVPRPDLYWEVAKRFYPEDRYMCVTDKDAYETSKIAFWSSLGERTRVLPSAALPKVSATLVKSAIKAGVDYRSHIPEACLSYFESIAGPARLSAAKA